jgi:hypothetical protein
MSLLRSPNGKCLGCGKELPKNSEYNDWCGDESCKNKITEMAKRDQKELHALIGFERSLGNSGADGD